MNYHVNELLNICKKETTIKLNIIHTHLKYSEIKNQDLYLFEIIIDLFNEKKILHNMTILTEHSSINMVLLMLAENYIMIINKYSKKNQDKKSEYIHLVSIALAYFDHLVRYNLNDENMLGLDMGSCYLLTTLQFIIKECDINYNTILIEDIRFTSTINRRSRRTTQRMIYQVLGLKSYNYSVESLLYLRKEIDISLRVLDYTHMKKVMKESNLDLENLIKLLRIDTTNETKPTDYNKLINKMKKHII